MTTAVHPLLEVARSVSAEAPAQRVAVVFDLDSTLFCVAPRTQHILRTLGTSPEFITRHPRLAEWLAAVEVRPDDYSVRAIVARFGLRLEDAAVFAVRDHWHQHFFSSDHLHRDLVYPAAAEYVRALESRGAAVWYLTGRGESRMRRGTERALREHGFPLADAQLLMKPSEVLTDEGFKAAALRELSSSYDVIWFFENEPVIITEVRALVPLVRVVFVRSAHSGKGTEPTDGWIITPDYSFGLE